MILHFAKWGNSLALRIPASYARDLGIHEGSGADVRVENGRLVALPVQDVPSYDLDELLAGMDDDTLHAEVATGPAVGNEFS
ncbi:AbrB/MazE/SpoVT family DNA-binding domain-containing protein [Caenispirillum bisanense]|uniref:AbrB/MazE/SpoVT family DNA-binding domain-containing protein n=1 Tax=Caenispirillum bisanense TaxID=414052 RepID=UPI0031E3D10D